MNTDQTAALLQPMPQHAIDSQRLNLWYGTFQALYNVDLRIHHGMTP